MNEKYSIWFFVGVLLAIYGVAICLTGLWEIGHPLADPPALVRLHAPVWWGGLLGAAGAISIFGSVRKKS